MGKIGGSSDGTKVWVAKGSKEDAEAAQSSPSKTLSKILSTPSTGPTYDRTKMLRYYEVRKLERKDEDSGPRLGRELSLSARPQPLEDETVTTSQTQRQKALRERSKRAASGAEDAVPMPDTPSQKIQLAQELPQGDGDAPYPAPDPYLQMYLNSMYSPMPPMYSPPTGYTTVMLRNIPNRYTRDMLVERLTEFSPKQFDFVYLPIDFNSKCNVGYAFINFRKPEIASKFISEFHGKKTKEVLPGFGSPKTCEVSYARVQGPEANMENLRDEKFIEKLTERPDWQPLFYDDQHVEVPFSETLGKPGKKRSRGDSMNATGPSTPHMMPMVPANFMVPPYQLPMYPPYAGLPVPAVQQPQESLLATELPHATASTMIYLRHVPDSMTRDALAAVLVKKGFSGAFDFLYLPAAENEQGNRGYAFINFVDSEKAKDFTKAFHGQPPAECLDSPAVGAKACEVVAARLGNLDKQLAIWVSGQQRAGKGERKPTWAPMLYGKDGSQKPFRVHNASAGKAAGKAAKSSGKGKDPKGKKPAAPPPPPFPVFPGYGYHGIPGVFPGYPYYPFPAGFPGMPPGALPQYTAGLAQAAHNQARQRATAYAGQRVDRSAGAASGATQTLDDEQKVSLRKQIEFYFSVENLCKDLYLRAHMSADGWTEVNFIAQFPMVRKYRASLATIMEVLKESPTLELDEASCSLRLKDEEMRNKWAKVPDDYRKTVPKMAQ